MKLKFRDKVKIERTVQSCKNRAHFLFTYHWLNNLKKSYRCKEDRKYFTETLEPISNCLDRMEYL